MALILNARRKQIYRRIESNVRFRLCQGSEKSSAGRRQHKGRVDADKKVFIATNGLLVGTGRFRLRKHRERRQHRNTRVKTGHELN